MLNSFAEVKSILGIKSINCEWNDLFPTELLESNYSGTDLQTRIKLLADTIRRKNLAFSVSRKGLYSLGLLAEMFDLMLAYFVIDETNIEIFFYQNIATNEWLDSFKGLLSRRHFFNLVHSYKTLKRYTSMFELSTYYQLISPELPSFVSKTNVRKLNEDYILIQYINDMKQPTYRILKPGIIFKNITPIIEYDNTKFDSITMQVEDTVFTGDCIKHLWDGKEKEKQNISINCNNKTYILNPGLGELYVKTDNKQGVFVIEKFKTDAFTRIIIDKPIKGKRLILLSNGFIWYPEEEKFINLRSIKGFENLNVDLFGISTEEKGIILSLDNDSIECVPTIEFLNYLMMRNIL